MTTSFATLVRCLVLTGVVLSTSVAQAAFTPYVIREAGGAPAIIDRDDVTPGGKEFVIAVGGQKAAWGTSDADGSTIASLTNMSITRYDDTTRFAGGSGPAVAPYFNIWITDGTQFAVLANEPSNPSFFSLFETTVDGNKQYNLSFSDIQNEPVKVYETVGGGTNNTWVHAALGKTGMALTFADVANFEIQAPDSIYITNPLNAVGSGAPRELNTNIAYGFNWVFGDSLTNYVSGDAGYIVGNPAVPEPSTIAILGLAGLAGLAIVRRRRQA